MRIHPTDADRLEPHAVIVEPDLMIEHDIGVSNEATIEIKRLDDDYLEKE